MFQPLRRMPLAESAYQEIRQTILDGKFPPGAPLGEEMLASQLQTSRGPIREALNRLVAEGLVVNRVHRGMTVREFSPEDIVNIYSTRVVIESSSARLCIRHQSATIPLRRIVHQMRVSAKAENLEELTKQEFLFHRELCVASRNHYLVKIFDSLTAQIQTVLAIDNRLHSSRLPQFDFASEHEELIAALERADEDSAIKLLEHHIISGVGDLVMRHLPPAEAGRIGELADLLLGPRDLFLSEAALASTTMGR